MNEYKLTAWPDLPTEFRKTAFRRMVSELSQRHVTESHLQKCSGLGAQEVSGLLTYLATADMLDVRTAEPEKPKRWGMGGLFQAWSGRP